MPFGSAPDLITPVVGFRKWRIIGDHLASPYIPLRWDGPVVHARCYPANRSLLFGRGWLDQPHSAPHPDCKCGVYAWHQPPPLGPLPDPDRAVGIVVLWGRIEVHPDGMRAQHAAIKALGYSRRLGPGHWEAMRRIATGLGVDLVEDIRLPALTGRYGSPLPPALIPRSEEAA